MNSLLSFLSSFGNAMPGAVSQGLVWGIMAIGVYITFRVLDVADLTVDGSFATGGAVAVMMIRAGINPWLALLVALFAGMAAGLVTGLFHTKCGIPAILSGILTQLMLYSVNLRIMNDAANQSVSVMKYNLALSSRYTHALDLNNPILILALVLVAVIMLLYWFFGTELGCSLRATGNNKNMAKAQSINTDMNVILGLMFSNGLVAFSGGFLAQYQGFADVNMGRGAIVIGLAAVIIGEVIFGRIFKNFALRLAGVAIGSVIYYLVIQLVLILPKYVPFFKFSTNDLKFFTALIVALFLAIPYFKGKFKKKQKNKEGGAENA